MRESSTVTKETRILHITAGTPDWHPTQDEMKEIMELFKTAADSPGEGDSVVITRDGVYAYYVA